MYRAHSGIVEHYDSRREFKVHLMPAYGPRWHSLHLHSLTGAARLWSACRLGNRGRHWIQIQGTRGPEDRCVFGSSLEHLGGVEMCLRQPFYALLTADRLTPRTCLRT